MFSASAWTLFLFALLLTATPTTSNAASKRPIISEEKKKWEFNNTTTIKQVFDEGDIVVKTANLSIAERYVLVDRKGIDLPDVAWAVCKIEDSGEISAS
jgi:hypothetical protein